MVDTLNNVDQEFICGKRFVKLVVAVILQLHVLHSKSVYRSGRGLQMQMHQMH